MNTCSGIRRDGERCRAQAMRGSEWCLNHDPERAEENKRRGSKGGKRGGRGRPRVELGNIRTQLQDLVDGILDGSIDKGNGAVAGQLLNYMTRCIQVEMQAREQEELVERLEALEREMSSPHSHNGGSGAQDATLGPLTATRFHSPGL
jgi:hypothetical protein